MPTVKPLILLLMFFSASAFSCDKTLKVGINQVWPPYILKQEEHYYGIEIDIIKRVFNDAGFCLEFVTLPSSARGFVELEHGNVDVLPAASFTEQRATYSYFSVAYRDEVMRLFWFESSSLKTKTLAKLLQEQQTMVVNSGGYYGEEFATLSNSEQFNHQIFKVPSLRQRMEMLQAKRVNFAIDDQLAGLYYLHSHNLAGVTMHPFIVNDNPIYYMLSKKTVSMSELDSINKAIEKNRSTIDIIMKKYVNLFQPHEH